MTNKDVIQILYDIDQATYKGSGSYVFTQPSLKEEVEELKTQLEEIRNVVREYIRMLDQ